MRRPPEVKISKEHVFGDWLREVFPRDGTTTHTHGTITWPPDTLPQSQHEVWLDPRGHGHSGSKKIGVVCRSCNGTWLSNDLEDAAKPILIPLVGEMNGTLTKDMQRILATWTAKTVMTSEHVNRGKAVVQQSERTHLKDNLLPPEGWFIWAAPYSGSDWKDLGIFQHTTKLNVPTIQDGNFIEHNLGQTFIGLGHLFLLIRHTTWSRLWDTMGSEILYVHRIWPSDGDVRWPPPHVLSDFDADFFAGFIAHVLNQRM
jgi:hypothetical protein